MSENNQTINSADNLHKLGKYPDDYNVRNNPTPKGLPEWRQKYFRILCSKMNDRLYPFILESIKSNLRIN